MGSKTTIQKIAELSGVSRGTVDRVLNNRSYVREDVRQRVLQVIAETGYVSPREIHLRDQKNALKPLRLGVLLPNFRHQFLDEVQLGIQKAQNELEDLGVKIFVKRCETDLPGEALSLLDELLGFGVSGLSVCALNDASISERLAALREQGIPSITFNSDLPDSGRLLFISQDIRRTGRIAAELMMKCIRPGEQILAAVGNMKFDGHQQRLIGFRERLDELGFPKKQLLFAETFNDYATTMEAVSMSLRRSPQLHGIYMANHSVSGCVEAIRLAGRSGSVHVICHDINPGIRQLLLDGLVDFTIPQDFIHQGYAPLICLTAYLRGKAFPASDVTEGAIQILCRENL